MRAALRYHPDADTVLNGRRVNDLTLGNLYDALRQLNIDPDAIARDALNGTARPLAETPAMPDQDQDPNTMPTDDTDTDTAAPDCDATDTLAAAIESEVQAIRSLIVTGGFSMLDDKLRALVTEARKPPVEDAR